MFDSEYTLAYKKVPELQVPAKYIIKYEDQYISLEYLLINTLDYPLIDIYDTDKIRNFSVTDFVNVFIKSTYKTYYTKHQILEKINEFIANYNEKYEVEKPLDPYEENELFDQIRFWNEDYKKLYKEDLIKLQEILNVQEALETTEPLEAKISYEKENLIDKSSFLINPQVSISSEKLRQKGKYEIITNHVQSSIILFNNMKASILVPYIQLNFNDKQYYKVYEADSFRNIKKLFEVAGFDKPNYIYMKVLINNEYGSTKNNSYTEVKYSLEDNELKFTCEGKKQRDAVMNRIRECFVNPEYKNINIYNIDFAYISGPENYREFNLQGEFIIENFNIDKSAIHFLIYNEKSLTDIPLISTYFFIDDSELVLTNREYLKLKFNDINEEEPEGTTLNPSSITFTFIPNQDNKNLVIQFHKAANEDVLNKSLEILLRILAYYKDLEPQILDLINNKFTQESDEKEFVSKRKVKVALKEVFEDKIKQLRYEAENITKGLFDKNKVGYTRRCDCKKQPIIVPIDEVDDWKNKTFIDKGEIKQRQIAPFPPPPNEAEKSFLYVCPGDDYPYPTVIENPEGGAEYPYIPCCAGTDNINNPKSNYNNYYSTKPEEEKDTSKIYKITTMKQLEPDRVAEIPAIIQELLNTPYEIGEKFKYERYSVGKQENTLIQCVLHALNVQDYQNLPSIKDKENFCNFLRKKIPETLSNYYEIVKQEVFDYNLDDIKNEIRNSKKEFSSYKYYRILEELFNVNIFVFNFENSQSLVEIPRHILSHIRNYRVDRKSIIVIKHYGGELEALKFPIYDLIFNTGVKLIDVKNKKASGSGRTFLFGEEMTKFMFSVLQNYNENYLFTVENINCVTRYNPFNKINIPEIFKNVKLVSQYIDVYGKMRAINIDIANGELQTIWLPMSQPIDLPIDNTIYTQPESAIVKIFGKYSAAIEDGLWYKIIDFEYGVFIPCKPKTYSVDSYIPTNPIPSKNSENVNNIEIFRNLYKYSYMLLEMIKWGLKSNGILTLKDYMENRDKFIILDDSVPKNAFPDKMISYITDKGDFRYLNSIWSSYFIGNSVHLYSDLYYKVIQNLERYYTLIDGDIEKQAPNPYLNNIFEYEWDFDIISKNRIFIDRANLDTWINNHEKNNKYELEIYEEINTDKIKCEDPFIYYSRNEKKMYLIQNVSNGNMDKALYCGYSWYLNRVNPGYDCPMIGNEEIPYVIYSVDNSLNIFIGGKEDIHMEDINKKEYITILRYSTDSYAALLNLY